MNSAWVLITSGQGPAECQLLVERVAHAMEGEARDMDLKVRTIETIEGERSLPRSTLLAVEGETTCAFARDWSGTIQWICPSPFRPKHRRKNWFAGVFTLPAPETVEAFVAGDVRFQTMKAGGPGGQHVNTTDSAVRAVHEPTGLTVIARAERSQHANKRLALAKIAAALEQGAADNAAAQDHDVWQAHHKVERGNPVRVYEGTKFSRKR